MPRITVNGRIIEVPEGRTILEALDDLGLLMNGVDIPHYCWHPKLPVDGSCRLCQVEVEGAPKLQIACNTPVTEGMAIRTDTESVSKAREGVMELLLVNHPLDCPICDQAGECKLQDYAYEYGAKESRTREPRQALKKRVEIGPRVVFDQERCILCRRCVRFCKEITGTKELRIFNRGDRSVVDAYPGFPLDNDYSMNVVDLCPVGALTSNGCANGCNVYMGVANNKVYRYVPRRNDDVNDTWLCDAGRLSYERIGSGDRLRSPLVRAGEGPAEPTGYDAALAEAAERLRLQRVVDEKGAGSVVALASPHATNEDLFTFHRFASALGVGAAGVAVVSGNDDDLLIKAEKAANAVGARAIGFEDAAGALEKIRGGEAAAAVVMGHDLLDEAHLGGADALGGLQALIVLDTHQSALQGVAHVSFPVRHAAEKLGTLTTHAGRVQRVRPALEPAWEAWTEGEVIAKLGAALGLEGFDGCYDVHSVSKLLAEANPAFAGVHLGSVGDQGRPLAGAGEAVEGEQP